MHYHIPNSARVWSERRGIIGVSERGESFSGRYRSVKRVMSGATLHKAVGNKETWNRR